MNDFFSSMCNLEYYLWLIALPATIIFFLQLILVFIAGDFSGGDDDVDLEFDSNINNTPFQMFTLRNILAYLSVSSWASILCIKMNISDITSLTIGMIMGFTFILMFSSALLFVSKILQKNINSVDYIGENAIVYKNISKMNIGKITLMEYGKRYTFTATSEYEIPKGAIVKIVGKKSNKLIVEPLMVKINKKEPW